MERIQEAVDKGRQVIGIFCDLTKAYDVLNHKILEKLVLRSKGKCELMVSVIFN
jgi:hypothetical protein